ncbi:MAG: DNA-binding protein AraC-type [Clostridia bacterium]|nr:DNA-binding protein AraC-type [Clostridia bacterium]
MEESALLKIKKGYLNEDFRFFHLKDKKSEEHTFHYHDFNKIVIFISGSATYVIEGKYYKLKPWDILFVGSNELHKPIIDSNEYYERIVLWINSDFLANCSTDDSSLSSCFELAIRERMKLFRFDAEHLNVIQDTLFSLEKEIRDRDFGCKILQNAIFVQLMVYLNRFIRRAQIKKDEKDIQYDERIVSILAYINENLDSDLSIDHIAARFYINRYYLMHHFKDQTGYTLHHYILQKRLAKAAMLIKKGMQITNASDQCGFRDYSSFVRAFKKSFGLSPKQYYKAIVEIQHSYGEGNPEGRDNE